MIFLNYQNKIAFKSFSTTSYLGADNDKTADEVQPLSANVSDDGSDSQAVSANVSDDRSDSQSVSANISDDGSGYETNPDRVELDDDGAAMFRYPARDLPDDKLKEFIKESREMYRYNLGPEEAELRQNFKDRNTELKTEKERRIELGTMSDDGSSVESDPSTTTTTTGLVGAGVGINPDVGAGVGFNPDVGSRSASPSQSSPKAQHSDMEKDKSSGNELPSSSNNKRKFEEDSESSVQPTKDFQDSRDITSEGEPFDFLGGDD